MGKKILFAVMALLVMATGKIWAEGETAYAVLCPNEGGTTYSMHFVYTTATEKTIEGGETEKTVDVTINGTTTSIKLTEKNHWEITNTNPNGWQSGTNNLTAAEKAKITEVVFEESFKDVKVTSCENWFFNFTKLEIIEGIKNLDTSQVQSMNSMFNGCSSLDTLDLSSFDTSSTINTASMFNGCSNLGKIIFGNNFKTSTTENMFSNCSKLTKLDLSGFDTSQRTENKGTMTCMFSGCSSLTSLNLSSFNTSNVTNMDQMFYNCENLSNLTLGSFDMTSVTSMYNMFYNCNKITINGNALVFVTSDDQKKIWPGSSEVKFVVKESNGDTYKYNGDVEINYSDNKETPLIISKAFTANSVTFTRTFTAGNPHTVCLPFAVNATEYGTFYKLSSYDKDNRKVKFTKVDKTVANTPYLFIPYKDKADVTKIEVTGGDAGVDISSTANEEYSSYAGNDYSTRFNGVYRKKTFTEQDLNSNYDFYGWTADGDFKKAGAGASVAPCRAYIRLRKKTTGGGSSDNAPARLSVEFDDGETTGTGTIGTAKSGADGGADAPMYNLQGQRVSGGYKGVVIKNGKKMIVR